MAGNLKHEKPDTGVGERNHFRANRHGRVIRVIAYSFSELGGPYNRVADVQLITVSVFHGFAFRRT